jgi:hypothetical protein
MHPRWHRLKKDASPELIEVVQQIEERARHGSQECRCVDSQEKENNNENHASSKFFEAASGRCDSHLRVHRRGKCSTNFRGQVHWLTKFTEAKPCFPLGSIPSARTR